MSPPLKQSKMNAMADALAAKLQACPELAGVDVFVDRQADVPTLVHKAVSGAKGLGISVLLSGFADADPGSNIPIYTVSYTVRVWGAAVLQLAGKPAGEAIAADYATEQALLWLRHWRHDPNQGINGEAQVSGGDLVPDTRYLTYEMTVTLALVLGPARPAGG